MKKKTLFFNILLFFSTVSFSYDKKTTNSSPSDKQSTVLSYFKEGRRMLMGAGLAYYLVPKYFKLGQFGLQGLRMGAGFGMQASGALLSAMKSNPKTAVAISALLIGAYSLKRMMTQRQIQQRMLLQQQRQRTPSRKSSTGVSEQKQTSFRPTQQRQKRLGQTQRRFEQKQKKMN